MIRAAAPLTAAVLTALALTAGAAAATAKPPIYQLSIVGGGENLAGSPAYPLGLNVNGRMVGYASLGGGDMVPLNWKDGEYRSMTLGSYDRMFGNGVNNLGRVVGGGYRLGSSGEILESRALKWTGGVMSDLGTLGGNHAVALSINNHEQVVGYSTVAGDTQVKAFRVSGGVMSGIDTLPGATESYPYDISDTGYIVGTAVVNGLAKPFRWSPAGPIPLRIPASSRTGAANAVNDHGMAVGTYEIDLNTGAHAAVLWMNGLVIDMGNLGGAVPYAVARDINNLGQAVGTSLRPDGYGAFLWQAGQLFDLQDLLVDLPDHVRIISANAINDRGVIAAAALINGEQSAVLLTPIIPGVPGPGSLALLAGVGAIAFRRRR